MKKKRTFRNYISTIAIIVIFVLGALLLLKKPKESEQASDPLLPIVEFSGEYKIAEGEWSPIEAGKHISATKGEVCLRGCFVMYNPETEVCIGNVTGGTVLSVYLNHLNMQMKLNEQVIYESEAEHPVLGCAACGQIWEEFTIPDSTEEPVTLVLTNPHRYGNENAIDQFLDGLNIYNGGMFERRMSETGKLQRTAGIAVVLAAVVILGVALFTSIVRIQNTKELSMTGCIILFAGGYYIFASSNICMWSYNYNFNTTILAMCKELYLFLVTAMIVTILSGQNRRLGRVLIWMSGILLAGTYVAVLANRIYFYDSWILWSSVEVLICIGLLLCLFRERSNLNKENAFVYIISIFLLISYVIDYVAVYFGWWEGARLSMMFFLVIFLGAAILVLKVVPENMNAVAKARELEAEQKLLQAKLHESRISVMMSQIQPHFMYNSLAVIQELCHEEPEKAEKAIGSLAEFLKGNMSILISDKVVSFEDELNHTMKYLEIEKLRFEDQLSVVYEINVDKKSFSLPALTLQPIVENAIRYGVRKKEDGGIVKISAEQREDFYEITVEDDGPGFEEMNSYDGDGMHIGIKNVRERLERMCDGALEIESEPGRGTRVKIQVKREHEEC